MKSGRFSFRWCESWDSPTSHSPKIERFEMSVRLSSGPKYEASSLQRQLVRWLGITGTMNRVEAHNQNNRSHPYWQLPAGGGLRRRLLLISWHFPPGPTAGSLRWQKLAEHAVERRWAVDAIALDPADVEHGDPERLDALPPGVRAFGVQAPTLPADGAAEAAWRLWCHLLDRGGGTRCGAEEKIDHGETSPQPAGGRERVDAMGGGSPKVEGAHKAMAKPPAWARVWWAWRDYAQGAAWAEAAARLGERLGREVNYDLVVTSGPPHMAHEAGRRVSRVLGLPLVMDLRDPWSLPRRLPADHDTPLWFALARWHERPCVEAADLVVVNTEPVREAMARTYPSVAERLLTVMNGYDDEPLPPPKFGERFVLAYAGGIYLDRDPRPLFRAVARLAREEDLAPESFGIELMGDVESFRGTRLATIAAREGIGPYVQTHPARPRQEMLRFLSGAQVLVSLPQDSPWAVPSKIFEYMRFPAWLLILAPPSSATARLLRPTAARVLDPEDEGAITATLGAWYRAYRRGDRPSSVASAGGFDRRTQADRLFDALDTITGATE